MLKFLQLLVLIGIVASCTNIKDLGYSLEGTSLNLSRKGLTEIPNEVFERKELKVLRLFGNKIDTIPDRIAELENLEKLFIGKNNLTYLPNAISRLGKLKILSAQYNEISLLPDSIVYMDNLEQIILNQNSIKYLPDSIGKMTNLENIELRDNELDSIPDSFGGLESLKFCNLSRNNIKFLPKSFGQLKYLRELKLINSGPLLDLPESMCKLRKLELLEIDGSVVIPTCLLVLQTTLLKIVVY